MIYWLSSSLPDIRIRSLNLFRSLQHHFGLPYQEVRSIVDVPGPLFIDYTWHEKAAWIERKSQLSALGMLRRVILVGVDDIPPFSVLPHDSLFDGVWLLEWLGCGCRDFYDGDVVWQFSPRGFPGVGLIRPIPDLPLIPFESRRSDFWFRGERGHTPLRQEMLDSFSGYISYDWLDHTDYLKEMGQFKFALCPTGYSHSWRVVEAMGMGCIPIVNDLEFLQFCHPFFEEGRNYLSVGPRLENVESVLSQCKDERRMSKIAAAARTTFEQYFAVRDDVLPLRTILPVVRVLLRLFPSLLSV